MAANYRINKLPTGGRQYVREGINVVMPAGSDIKEYSVLSHDNSVTPYFGVVLDPSLAVGPESTVKVFVNIPVDTGIFITDGSSYKMIDRIEGHERRFALYGSASDGMIYRYLKTKYSKTRDHANKSTIPTKIVITNKSKTWQVISKVVFLGKSFDIFSDSKGVLGERIHMTISDKEVITTKLGNVPSVKGAKIMPYSVILTKQGLKSDTVEMRYGP